MIRLAFLTGFFLLLMPLEMLHAEGGIATVTMQPGQNGEETWSLSLQALALMTALTLLPAFLLMMTSFTRITIVLGILRTAMGTAQTPSNQILLGLALFLTIFVMQPVFEKVYDTAVAPYMDEQISVSDAVRLASLPLTDFMLQQTREEDLKLFLNLSGVDEVDSKGEVDFFVLIPAFVTSELKTAFQIGFMLFIPFLIIDLVVASVLMSMGMMMLSPLIISLPFKLMLFVLVDGWTLVLGTLAGSFYL
ncbi:MAG: flagellar type III secretion system pore protein FliP [Gammaproteobacteria bacterium]|nr:flagellar type III secretion system pore protein FliP [Gammaproteobacteria bacterium]